MSPRDPSLPPALQALLVLSARLVQSPDDQRRFRDQVLALDDAAWDRLVRAASDLRVSGFLLKHLNEQDLAARIPASLRRMMEEQSRRLAVRGLKSYAQLAHIADAATSENIDLLLLKGAYLARWIYRDLALRPFNDFDIFCRPADVPALSRLLLKQGYVQDVPVAHSRIHARLAPKVRPHAAPFDQRGWPRIELHTALTVSHLEKDYPPASIWSRAVSLDWEDRRVFRLSLEDQIIHLALHQMRHLSFGLIKLFWLSDIHEVIRAAGPAFPWDRVAQEASILGVETRLAGLWRLLSAEWGTPVPKPWLLSPLQDDGRGTLPWLFLEGGSGVSERRLRQAYLGVLRLNRRNRSWRDKIVFYWKQLIPDRAYIRYRYKVPTGEGLLPWYIHHLRRGIRPFLPGAGTRHISDITD